MLGTLEVIMSFKLHLWEYKLGVHGCHCYVLLFCFSLIYWIWCP